MKNKIFALLSWPSEANLLLPDDVAEFERLLHEQLRPVPARPAFVRDLGKRLAAEIAPGRMSRKQAIEIQNDVWQRIFLTVAGIVSGAVLILLGVRAIISIFTTIGLRQQARRIT